MIFERARFNRRNQMEGESVEQYITALYSFAENCEYGEWKDQMNRDRLVVGIRDTSLSERLQMDPDLTLENAKKTVRQKEAVKEQQQLLKGDTTLPDTPNVDHVTHSKGTRTTTGAKWHSKGGSKGKCTNCGNNSHPREQCPARNATCFACQKVGHFSAHCRSRQSKMDLVTEETHLDSAFLGPLGQTSWTVDITVNGAFLTFKVDTGAEVTAIFEQAYRTLGTICKLEKTSKTLFGPTKVSLHVMGQMQATVRDAEHTCQQTVYGKVYEKRDLACIIKKYDKNALRLICYNFRTVSAINFLFSTLYTAPFLYGKIHFGVLHLLRVSIATVDTPPGSNPP